MATYQESKLLREIAKCERELIALKSPQRYSTRQVKGYRSNTLRIDSYICYQSGSTIVKGIEGTLRFRNDTLNKVALPRIVMEFYNSSGTRVFPNSGGGLYDYSKYLRPTGNPNEFTCVISCNWQQPPQDFYVLCWVSSNDTGILEVLETHVWYQ